MKRPETTSDKLQFKTSKSSRIDAYKLLYALDCVDEMRKNRRNIYIIIRNKDKLSEILHMLYLLNYCSNYELWSDYYVDACKERDFLVLEILIQRRVVKSPLILDKDKFAIARKSNRVLVDLDYYRLTVPRIKLKF